MPKNLEQNDDVRNIPGQDGLFSMGLGRRQDNKLLIKGGQELGIIGRQHALISRGPDGRLTVTDLGSVNGTFIDGHRVKSHQPYILAPGQLLAFGAEFWALLLVRETATGLIVEWTELAIGLLGLVPKTRKTDPLPQPWQPEKIEILPPDPSQLWLGRLAESVLVRGVEGSFLVGTNSIGGGLVIKDDSLVSQRHCFVRRAGNDLLIGDIRSSNGIYINNQLVGQKTTDLLGPKKQTYDFYGGVKLRFGDRIQVGRQIFLVIENTYQERTFLSLELWGQLAMDL